MSARREGTGIPHEQAAQGAATTRATTPLTGSSADNTSSAPSVKRPASYGWKSVSAATKASFLEQLESLKTDSEIASQLHAKHSAGWSRAQSIIELLNCTKAVLYHLHQKEEETFKGCIRRLSELDAGRSIDIEQLRAAESLTDVLVTARRSWSDQKDGIINHTFRKEALKSLLADLMVLNGEELPEWAEAAGGKESDGDES